MAPLPCFLRLRKVLLLSLFSTILLVSFFFVLSTSQSQTRTQTQTQNPTLFLGRRSLLATKDVEDEDFLGEVVPRKKKPSISDDDDLQVKKKKSSSSEKDETSLKKKKSPSSSEDEGDLVMSSKKKKSSFSYDENEAGDVEKTKKKKSSSLQDDEIQVSKKKKSSNVEEDEKQVEKKKKLSNILDSNSSKKDESKIIKSKSSNLDSSLSKKDETKVTKPILSASSNNKTKTIKPTSKDFGDSSSKTPTIAKLNVVKKVNSTSKPSNSTKIITKKSIDLTKSATKSVDKTTKSSQSELTEKKTNQKSQNLDQKRKVPSSPDWTYQNDEDEDLVAEIRDLPSKFHQSFMPDLHRISTTSKVYLTKYNKEITKGFKPYVGNKYAPSLATAISCAFIIIPFLLVSLLFNRIKAYFSLQKIIIFIQIYLAIYFTILCFSSLITGLEPLRFFYATSQSTYIWLQVLQTLGYVLYLLTLLMYLVLVFSTDSDMGQKFLGLGQTFVGFSVGLHYYMTVFHRVVLRQPPKTNWKIHGIYATCFLVICLLASAERRKKAYLVEGSEEGKTS